MKLVNSCIHNGKRASEKVIYRVHISVGEEIQYKNIHIDLFGNRNDMITMESMAQ